MTYQGRVQNGVIVLDDHVRLPDGTVVSVQTIPPPADGDEAEADRLAEAMLKLAGTVTGLPPDFARNHDHYLHGQPKR